jgi:hypothetical protein
MLLSRHQNVGQNRDIKIANRSFENVSQFKYLGTAVTNQNLIEEEIKRRLNSGNACYHSVQNLGEVGWGDVDWICLAQDRNRWRALVNSVLNLRVP